MVAVRALCKWSSHELFYVVAAFTLQSQMRAIFGMMELET